ncbi:DUF58 domain-containing protein [Treponema pedis]|uniref:DUF58 domain-containing protein n=1 Tax=Treponema pedis TaxID=409322 RepID=UPI000425D9F1|nr:DUF58 domain-containing protein [Treponema pedis]
MKIGFIAERAKQLKISSLSVSEGLRTGGFSSAFRGHGIEFDSVREYEAGDDVRSIDWNLTARSGKTFFKLHREERDLTVFLCIDFSLSMEISSNSISPKEKAVETAALLAFAARNIFSPVGALFFSSEKGPLFIPHEGEDYILTILKSMENFAVSVKSDLNMRGTNLASSLTAVSKVLRSRSLVIVISDFKVEGFEKQLGFLASKNDVVCIRLASDMDSALPKAGTIPAKDSEADFKMLVPTGNKNFQTEYAKAYYEELLRWKNLCKRCLAHPILLNINDDAAKVLSNFFLSKQNNRYVLKNNIEKIGEKIWKEF